MSETKTFITVNDILINYSIEGPEEAPPIIFIHGFPLNLSMWDKQVEALKRNYRVVTYDIRGHGHTEQGREDLSIDLFVNDLIGLIDLLNIKKAILCGLSMGGYIALNAILSHPERFNALILCDTQCMADTAETKEKRIRTIADINENGIEKYAAESLKNLLSKNTLIIKQDEAKIVRDMILGTSAAILCKMLYALYNRKDTCSRLHEIKVPALIIVGKEDKITPLSAALIMHGKLQNSQIVIVEAAGHLSNLDNPVEFNRNILSFLSAI